MKPGAASPMLVFILLALLLACSPAPAPTPTRAVSPPTPTSGEFVAQAIQTATLPPPSPTLLPSATALPSPTLTAAPTQLPTNVPTRPPTLAPLRPLPTAGPTLLPATPQAAPGLYVTWIRVDPDQPIRGRAITFYVAFWNNGGGQANFTWIVQIFDAETGKPFGETSATRSTLEVGNWELTSPSDWMIRGPGPCLPYFAQAHLVKDDKSRAPIPNTDGTVFSAKFQVCPPS